MQLDYRMVPHEGALVKALACCHSLTRIDGLIRGDPLDLVTTLPHLQLFAFSSKLLLFIFVNIISRIIVHVCRPCLSKRVGPFWNRVRQRRASSIRWCQRWCLHPATMSWTRVGMGTMISQCSVCLLVYTSVKINQSIGQSLVSSVYSDALMANIGIIICLLWR